MWKVNIQTTDAKWWQNLTWPLTRWAKMKTIILTLFRSTWFILPCGSRGDLKKISQPETRLPMASILVVNRHKMGKICWEPNDLLIGQTQIRIAYDGHIAFLINTKYDDFVQDPKTSFLQSEFIVPPSFRREHFQLTLPKAMGAFAITCRP